jgi:starch-binding outer membrane protein, SusD/RagB family
MKTKYFIHTFYCLLLLVGLSSCKKIVAVDSPPTRLVTSSVYASNSTATAAVNSIYARMANTGLTDGSGSVSVLLGLYADELKNYAVNNTNLSLIYTNSLTAENRFFWNELFQQLYVVNAAIEGLSASEGLTPSRKKQLMGEVKFIRAFLFFYAVNIFGEVPLVTSTDYLLNNRIGRSSIDKIYEQIILDLKDAQLNLDDDYLTPNGTVAEERVRPNKNSATALLARIYLYKKDWAKAESEASTIIDNTNTYVLEDSLNNVFLINSKEAIWQMQSVRPGYNTALGAFFVLTSSPGTGGFSVAMSSQLRAAFEKNDMRWTNWVGRYISNIDTFYFPYKYKKNIITSTALITEYTMVLRLAEQYLIRAEAKINQHDVAGAKQDLNKIRSRAGLPDIDIDDEESISSSIIQERRIELFTEWGHRWFDMVRNGIADDIMSIITPEKGGVWRSSKKIFPVPQGERIINPNLSQNNGY